MRRTFAIMVMVVGMVLGTMSVASAAPPERYQLETYTIDVELVNDIELYAHEATGTYNPCDDSWTWSVTGFDEGEFLDGDLTGGTYTGRYNIDSDPGNSPYTFTVELAEGGDLGEASSAPQPYVQSVEGEWTVETTDYKNHGEFVRAGGDEESCIGQPVVADV